MNRSLREGEVEELKLRADIYSIISSYVNLKRSGRNYVGLCPFHKEKTPSFTVDPTKQLFHCFGCGQGGDAISFIMKIENMEFIEAVEFLAKKVGYNLKYSDTEFSDSGRAKTRLFELTELAKKYYNFILFNSKKGNLALDYLSGRGFNREILEQFEVGYSLNSWTDFSEFARKRGFSTKEILECGLGVESSKGSDEVYDRFRGRIIFPIKDALGNTIGFGGRIIPGREKVGKESAKYINTPETKIYSKSKSLYGIFEAKHQIVKEDKALVVEGYTDVIALHQHGIKNVVASLGTALTLEQIGILGRFTKNVVLVFDSDEAGMSASLRGMERLMEYNQRLDLYQENNIDISVAILEEGYDPSDFVLKKGRDNFLKKVENSINIIDFTMDMILAKYDISTLNGKLRASDKLLEFISTISSKIVQEECIKKISQKLDLRESLLFEEMLKKSGLRRSGEKVWRLGYVEKPDETKKEKILPFRNIEVEALKMIIKGIGGELLSDLISLGEEYFRFDDTKKLYLVAKNKIESANKKGEKVNFPLEITSEEMKREDEDIENIEKLYHSIIFSEVSYKDENIACLEILNNLKKIYITDEVGKIKKRMLEIEDERKRLSLSQGRDVLKEEEKLDNEYDNLYQKLIELEKEKLKLSTFV